MPTRLNAETSDYKPWTSAKSVVENIYLSPAPGATRKPSFSETTTARLQLPTCLGLDNSENDGVFEDETASTLVSPRVYTGKITREKVGRCRSNTRADGLEKLRKQKSISALNRKSSFRSMFEQKPRSISEGSVNFWNMEGTSRKERSVRRKATTVTKEDGLALWKREQFDGEEERQMRQKSTRSLLDEVSQSEINGDTPRNLVLHKSISSSVSSFHSEASELSGASFGCEGDSCYLGISRSDSSIRRNLSLMSNELLVRDRRAKIPYPSSISTASLNSENSQKHLNRRMAFQRRASHRSRSSSFQKCGAQRDLLKMPGSSMQVAMETNDGGKRSTMAPRMPSRSSSPPRTMVSS